MSNSGLGKSESEDESIHLGRIIRNNPVTTILSLFTILMYYAGFGGDRCYYTCPLDWNNNDVLTYLLHPFIHNNQIHLYGNLFGLVIIGYLIESWMTAFSKRERYLMFLTAYAISYLVNLVVWVIPKGAVIANGSDVTGIPGIGASIFVFALLVFPLRYYFTWATKLTPSLNRTNMFAPVLLGLILSPLVIGFYTMFFNVGDFSTLLHFAGFVVALPVSGWFFRRKPRILEKQDH